MLSKKIVTKKCCVVRGRRAVDVDCLLVRSGGSDRCFTLPLVCIGSGLALYGVPFVALFLSPDLIIVESPVYLDT